MTAFFVGELASGQARSEDVYEAVCRSAQAATGHFPRERRIFRLWCRRGGSDCQVEVGRPAPLLGGTVWAILDLGRGLPYLIHCGDPADDAGVALVLVDDHVYEVTEFGS